MEFPRTAVIEPASIADAWGLVYFLADHGFKWDGGNDLTDGFESRWEDEDDFCFDIESTQRIVSHCNRHYYMNEFADDYPDLVPDEDRWFLCSVDDFISMCKGEAASADFDTADDTELSAFLFERK